MKTVAYPNVWHVYYMNNDGQKVVLEDKISYERAVRLWQYYNTLWQLFGCDYAPTKP